MTRTIFAALFAVGMLLGMAGMASAAAISCGDCHSTPPLDSDNCSDNARELHGTHVNYSSVTYPDVDNKCDYCHTATTGTAPTATHNDNTVDIASTKAASLAYDDGTRTCTDACHANNASSAKWGNYTAVVAENIKLTCVSCHDDSTEAELGTSSLGGAHEAHLRTNITVAGLNNDSNADCNACHPDNVNDLWSAGQADDGSVKVYPHASDGTNVASANAELDAGLSHTNCASACHNNTTADVWSDTELTCNSCHYNTSGTIMGGSHDTHVVSKSFPCSYCHSVPGAGDTSHVSAMPAAADNAAVIADPGPNAGASWDDGTNTCSNTGSGCHGSNDAVWGVQTCITCHNYPDGNNWSANNGHAVQYGSPVVNTHMGLATGYNKDTDTYAAVTADGSKCGKCHSGGTHKDDTIDVAGNSNNYCGSGDFTVTVNTSGSDVTCDNVSCHSGQVTPNWW